MVPLTTAFHLRTGSPSAVPQKIPPVILVAREVLQIRFLVSNQRISYEQITDATKLQRYLRIRLYFAKAYNQKFREYARVANPTI